MKKLISVDEAVPHKGPLKAPCSDCPFRRDALRGWLGGSTPEEFIAMAHSDTAYPCHAFLGPQCAGLAIYRANVAKLPRSPHVQRLNADRVAVFASIKEFLAHHKK